MKPRHHLLSKPLNTLCALLAVLQFTPALPAATFYLDLNGTTPGFDAGPGSYTADLTTTATWSTDTNGVLAPVLFTTAAGDNIQIGYSNSDFSGETININMSDANNIGASPGAFVIVSTNVVVTMSGAANCRFNHPFTWTVPAGSTLILTTTANNNGWNFNSEAATLTGNGLMQFQDAFCANANSSTASVMNMPGGTNQLSQSKTSNFGNSTTAAGFTLTAGALQFMNATALADTFSAFSTSASAFSINGGSIDNLSGSPGTNNLGHGIYKFGGNFLFPGTSSLNLGTNAVTLTANTIITNLANVLTLGGVSGTGFGLTFTGPGTVAINGSSTYTGPTTVNSGTLALVGVANLAGTSAISLGSGSTLDMSAFSGSLSNSHALALTNTTLLLRSTVTGTTNLMVGALTLGGASNVLNIISLPVVTNYPTAFHLISYSNTLNLTNFVLGPLPVLNGAQFAGYINTSNANLIDLVLTNGPAPARNLVWAGKDPSNPTFWDVLTTANWSTNSASAGTTYNQLDFVKFDDSSAGSSQPGHVSLQTTLTPSSLTVTNNALNYIFTGNGSIGDPSTGPLQLVKQGTGMLTMDNNTPNTYSGGTLINAGSTIQVGNNNDGAGDLGVGPVINNGALIFDGGGDGGIVANAISGTGTILQSGSQTLKLAGASTFTGTVTATNGVLQIGSAAALGAAKAITITSGAVLDLDGQSLGAIPVTAQGAGNIQIGGNQGAIDNSGATITGDLGLEFLTLTGNTTLSTSGGPTAGRWDLRSPGGDSGVVGTSFTNSTAGLSTGGQPYNLTLEGSGFLGIVSAWVDPKLANIEIVGGTLDYEGGATGLGNPTNTLQVDPSAILELWNTSNALNKIIALTNSSIVFNGSGSNAISGPIIFSNTPGNSTPSICEFEMASGTTLNLLGPISGNGQLETFSAGAGTLILNGGNSFSGGIQQNIGSIVVNGNNSLVTNATMMSGGTLTINGILGGATTNTVGALSGSGTNLGAMDVGGTFTPGGAGTIGTFAVGSAAVPSSLTLEGSANVTFDLNFTNAVGSGANDLIAVNGNLILNGGTFTINPLGILQDGASYTVITYSGTLTTVTLPSVSPVNNYNFTINTSVPGKISIVPSAGPPLWNGGAGAQNTTWTDSANWGGITIQPGNPLYFGGTVSLANTNNTTPDSSYGNITFIPGAGPFVLYGSNLQMNAGSFINNSSNPQTVEMGLDFSASFSLTGGASATAPLIVGGGLNDSGNDTLVVLNGMGTLSNIFTTPNGAGTGTNALETTNSTANWTIVDNPQSTNMTLPWGFEVLAGTVNFGTATSAPNFTSTPVNGTISPNLDNQVGDTTGATGTFNMVNGTLTCNARFNTALLANSTGIVNMTGGTWNLGSQFQGANGSNPGEVSILNVSGGTLNVGTAAAPTSPIYVASRGAGAFTVSGTGVVNCGVLDVSRDADGNTIGSTGTVNLNGGVLTCTQIGSATANSQTGPATTGPSPTAAFNFNGGTLVAGASTPNFLLGSTVAPIIPIVTTVKAGGAIINDNGFTIGIGEILAHDATLGTTNDGGLVKFGPGTLTLTRTNTYTGPTIVSNGTLAVSGVLAAASAVTVDSGATLSVSGTVNGIVTNNGTVVGTGTIVDGILNGGNIAPGGSNTVGTLAVNGVITNLPSGTTTILLLRGSSPSNSVLAVPGTLTYGGNLVVTNLGAPLALGDTFKLFSALTYSGSFASITLPALSSGLAWQTSSLTNGVISVIAGSVSPIPVISSVIQSLGNLVFSGTNGTPNATFYVLNSTNLALPQSQWNPVLTNSYSASGSFVVTNSIGTNGQPGFFILSSAP